MDDFAATIAQHNKKNLSEKKQKKAGNPVYGTVEEEHKNFLKTLFTLIDKKEIDPMNPQTFLKKDVYEGLSEEWQGKVDLSLLNIANQIRLIDNLRQVSKGKDSIHIQTMVEQLWEMKQRIEEHYDAFKF